MLAVLKLTAVQYLLYGHTLSAKSDSGPFCWYQQMITHTAHIVVLVSSVRQGATDFDNIPVFTHNLQA